MNVFRTAIVRLALALVVGAALVGGSAHAAQSKLTPAQRARACAELGTKLTQTDAAIVAISKQLKHTTNSKQRAALIKSLKSLNATRSAILTKQNVLGCYRA